MNELLLSKENDIYLDGDRIARIGRSSPRSVAASVRQAVLCMLRTEEGEAFADIEEGVPWFGRILGLEAAHLDVATKIIREKILAVGGVAEVVSLNLDVDGRKVGGRFVVRCTDGETTEGNF